MAAKSKKKFSVNLQFSIAFTLVLAIFATATIIQLPWYIISKRNIANVILNLNREITNGITREIGSLFDYTVSSQKTINDMLSRGLADVENREQLGKLYMTFLESNENFSWVSFGWPNGDFFGAQRESKESMKLVDSIWRGNELKATRKIDFYDYKNGTIKFLSSHQIEKHPYYAPQRSWFKKAIINRNHIWTDVYVFSTSKKPGINSAITLVKNGKAVGVVSIAIELDMISNYLKSIEVSKNGTVFILNNRKELIAFHDQSEITFTKENSEKPQLKTIEKSENKFIQAAVHALTSNKVKISDIKEMTMFVQNEQGAGNYYITFSPAGYLGWTICTVIPEEDYLYDINHNVQKLLIYLGIFVLITLLVIFFFSKYLFVKPILQITEQVQDVKDLKLDNISVVYTHISEINTLSKSMVQMATGLKAFNKYLPTDLVRKLISRGIEAKLGGEEKVITAFFSDLVSFTKISEQYGNALIPFLGDCLGDMSREIDKQNGTIDKYIGDAIMAFWGAPIPNKKHATDACRAALHCQRILAAARNNTKDLNRPEFKARIGLNTGTVIVGNMGYEDRMDYTILGDPVNVASRLEAINKLYGTEILIGEDTFLEAKDDVIVRKIDIVALYGKTRGLDVYELLAMKDEVGIGDDFSWIQIFETGLSLFMENQWEQALLQFDKVNIARHQEDGPSKYYINKCKEYMVCPPKAERNDGITVMTSK